jgi:ATP-binding cassette subfamily F protein 3
MDVLIKASALCKSFEGKPLFDNTTFEIHPQDCIGLLGPNGSGKTTLFNILQGDDQPSSGDLWRTEPLTIRRLNQIAINPTDTTAADFFTRTTQPHTLQHQIQALENQLQDPAIYNTTNYTHVLDELQRLRVTSNRTDSTIRWDAAQRLLKEIGITNLQHTQPIKALSGGEQQKIALASVLAKPDDCDLLLLDEPTNHLDIDTIEWLERKIADFPHALIIISHDRYLLDDLVDRVFEIEAGTIQVYNSTFAEYEETKQFLIHSKQQAFDKYRHEVNRQKKVLDTLTRRNKYDRQIASKVKRLEKLQHVDNPVLKSYLLRFQFKSSFKSGKNVAEAEHLTKAYDDRPIITDVTFEILAGQKIGLIGPNGCGKTTLLKILIGEVPLDSGTLRVSSGVRMGYFDQGHLSLNLDNTLIQEICRDHIELAENDAKALLGQFNFKGIMVDSLVSQLSGGERARLAILRLIMQPYNVLILDEPTNHMDMQSKEAIETALNSYNGTVITVSHDRRFLDAVTDNIFFMENGIIKTYSGNYTSFRLQRIKELADLDAAQQVIMAGSTKYVVRKKFTIWSTKTKHEVGDILYIGEHNEKTYEWALKNKLLVPYVEYEKKK